MKHFICSLIVCCIFGCSSVDHCTDDISQNKETSGCGGFAYIYNRNLDSEDIRDENYCSGEKLRWQYNEGTGTVEILLVRWTASCLSEPEIIVNNHKNNSYVISVIDNSDSEVYAKCMCFYDMYCELSEIVHDKIVITFEDKVFELILSEKSGWLEIDDSYYFSSPCYDGE